MTISEEKYSERFQRAAVLLQYHFERRLSVEEAGELIAFWDSSPEFERFAVENLEIEQYLRFYGMSSSSSGPDDSRDFLYGIEHSLFSEPSGGTDPIDLDELVSLAIESMPPKKPSATAVPPAADSAGKKTPPRRVFSKKPLAFKFVLCLFITVVSFSIYYVSGIAQPVNERPDSREFLGSMTRSVDVAWPVGTLRPKPGEPLSSGAFSFKSGMIELLFFNGVRAIVQGPAEFVLLSEKHVFCRKGQWSVTVPEQGTGFEIQMPGLTVCDLGTRFHLNIAENHCDLDVVEGAVETKNLEGEKTIVTAGRHTRFHEGKPVMTSDSGQGGFVSSGEFHRIFADFLSQNIAQDDQKPGVRKEAIAVVRFAYSRAEGLVAADASIFGGHPVPGRQPASKAFHLDGRDARIRLKPLGMLPSTTIVLDLRIDRLRDEFSPILTSEGSSKGGIVMAVREKGSLMVGVRPKDSEELELYETPVLFTKEQLGKWTQLVLCFDKNEQTAAVYMDGYHVFVRKIPFLPVLDMNALDVGGINSFSGHLNGPRGLDGAVQRVRVFPRCLSHEEIYGLSDRSFE